MSSFYLSLTLLLFCHSKINQMKQFVKHQQHMCEPHFQEKKKNNFFSLIFPAMNGKLVSDSISLSQRYSSVFVRF